MTHPSDRDRGSTEVSAQGERARPGVSLGNGRLIEFPKERLLAWAKNEALVRTIQRNGSPPALAIRDALATLNETPTEA